MSNVLSDEKREQVIALGRLGWTLRRIEEATGVRRETASTYLKAAGIGVRPPGGWGRRPPAKPAIEVTTDSDGRKPAKSPGTDAEEGEAAGPKPAIEVTTEPDQQQQVHQLSLNSLFNPEQAKPAIGVTTDSGEEGLANPPDSHSPANPEDSKPAIEVTIDSGPILESPAARAAGLTRNLTTSAAKDFRELIELGLSQGRNAMAIWQDLVSYHGFSAGYQSVKRFVRKLRGSQSREACGTITTAPGEEVQVDYGEGPMVRDPKTGKYRRTRLFVMTLGYSRKSVRLITFRSSSQTWAELHENAFRRLGGGARIVILDNLKEGVLTPDIYDPALNPVYRDMLVHYGAVAMPCRVADPDRKGKVESGVGHAQKTPLKGQRFESLEEAQEYLDHWEERWADTRIHGTTKRQVSAMFAEERPALLPLPLERFRYYRHGERTVHLDGCVEVEAAYYSAPPGWIGRRVKVQWDGLTVRLLSPCTGQLLREHLRQKRGAHRIKPEDSPKRMPQSTTKLLWRAEQAGHQIGVLCRTMHQQDGEPAIRRILGVLSLAKKYGPATVEDACAAALEMGVAEYRFIRRYLERGPQLSLTLRQVDPLIRQLVEYRDLINSRTTEVSE